MKPEEELKAKQAAMSDEELIELCHKEVGTLAHSYGASHHMSIPPRIFDTDMLLSELISRFEKKVFMGKVGSTKIAEQKNNSHIHNETNIQFVDRCIKSKKEDGENEVNIQFADESQYEVILGIIKSNPEKYPVEATLINDNKVLHIQW